MTLNQMKTLVAVVESGSITAAAKRLFVTQAAVSTALASLKGEVGVELFVREGRGVRLTEAGSTLYDYAKKILGLMEEAVNVTRGSGEGAKRVLRIAAVTTAGEVLLPKWLDSFLELDSQVEIKVEVSNRSRVFDLLESHFVDLAIAGSPPPNRPLESRAIRDHKLFLLVGGHRLTQFEALTDTNELIEVLSATPWLVREEGSGTRSNCDELIARLKIEPQLLTLSSNVAIKEACLLGVGVALLSIDNISEELLAGRLAKIDVASTPIEKSWNVVVRSGERLNDVVAAFLEHLVLAGYVRPVTAVERRLRAL
ncbi:MAG: LysR family transcriptional regulator [Actinomycetota bacterium]|nr:LysR family transcriptional regulator [Actinomycetota bacterium]